MLVSDHLLKVRLLKSWGAARPTPDCGPFTFPTSRNHGNWACRVPSDQLGIAGKFRSAYLRPNVRLGRSPTG
jgi:hypothetical protein